MLRNVNLNLLLVLQALLKTESVSEAAALIHRTPSAVSSSLSQLRDILQDPLFVRVGSQLQPTARALQLIEPVDQAIQQIETIFQEPCFDPASSQRVVVVALSDLLLVEVGAFLIKYVRHAAPSMSIQFVEIESNLSEALTSREVDFAILPEVSIDGLQPAPLAREALLSIKMDSVLMCQNHPLAGKASVGFDDLKHYPNIVFRPNDVLVRGVKHPSFELPNTVMVNNTWAVPQLLVGTDLCAAVPATISDKEKANSELTVVPLNAVFEIPFVLAWSSLVQHDEAHSWFRSTVFKHIANSDTSNR